MTEKKVYTKRIAYELRLKGFKIIRLEPNPNKPELNISFVVMNRQQYMQRTDMQGLAENRDLYL